MKCNWASSIQFKIRITYNNIEYNNYINKQTGYKYLCVKLKGIGIAFAELNSSLS